MLKYNFLVLLIIHILCDFYFQTEKMAKIKREKIQGVLQHSIIYFGSSAILIYMVMPGLPIYCFLSVAISHMLIDVAKYYLYHSKSFKTKERIWNETIAFILDQLMHIVIINLVTYFIRNLDMHILYRTSICQVLNIWEIPETLLIVWFIKILLIHKPANIFIANILSSYAPVTKNDSTIDDKKAGRFIGTLERFILVIFMSMKQYAAIGLVLTAKSIARYDKISKDQEFSEYYLLGTLLSVAYALSITILL